MRLIAGPSRLASRASTRTRTLATIALPRVPAPVTRTVPCALTRTPQRAPQRTFFSLPDISKLAGLAPAPPRGAVQVDGEEQRFHAKKILPYTPAQLYELVSDVPAYVTFIPFCTSSTVLDPHGRPAHNWKPGREPFTVDAELAVGFGGLEERYISHVVGEPFRRVSATASAETPLFKSLVTTWSFAPVAGTGTTPSSPGATLLTIDLAFSFANPLHRIASQAVLPRVADKMVEAFETRAHEVWGRGR